MAEHSEMQLGSPLETDELDLERLSHPQDFDEEFDKLTPDQRRALAHKLARLVAHQDNQLRSITAIGEAFTKSLQIDTLLDLVMGKITSLMNAERSTLFVLDKERRELWSVISEGVENHEIRLDVGHGIAGWVAANAEPIRIDDAYHDDRFNPEYDSKTGFKTESILCQPIQNLDGELLGVVQVLNSANGRFLEEDEHLLRAIAAQVAIALENSALYTEIFEKNQELLHLTEQLEERIAELDLLIDIESAIAHATSLEEIAESLTCKTASVFRAGAVLLTVTDAHGGTVYGYEPDASEPFRIAHQEQEFVGKQIVDTAHPYACHADCDRVPSAVEAFVSFPVSSLIAVPIVSDSGESIGALQALYSDSSSRFTTEELKVLTLIASQIAGTLAAQKQKEELERSERMAMMGQMLSGVIHDLKNPIAVISGYVQLMAKSDDGEQRGLFERTIKDQFTMLNEMTKELLEYAKGASTLFRRKVFVGDFFTSFRELLEAELNSKNVELLLNLDYIGPVMLDPSKFQRAVLNLARNAADSMPSGGEFEIKTSETAEHIVFDFRDSGAGIPTRIRDRLFEEFVTDGKENGTGLGLAIVRKVVEEHHGTISFESALNEGTVFTILLPKGV